MKRRTKLHSEEQQPAVAQSQSQPAAKEFATVEEMLRYDAANTSVPPTVARRLEQSIDSAPRPRPSWWRRLLGGTRQ